MTRAVRSLRRAIRRIDGGDLVFYALVALLAYAIPCIVMSYYANARGY